MKKSTEFNIQKICIDDNNKYHFTVTGSKEQTEDMPVFRFLFVNTKQSPLDEYSMPPNRTIMAGEGIYDVEGDFLFFDTVSEEGEWYLSVASGDEFHRVELAKDCCIGQIVCCENSMYVADYRKCLIPHNQTGREFSMVLQKESCIKNNAWQMEGLSVHNQMLTISLKEKPVWQTETVQANFVLYHKKQKKTFRTPIEIQELNNQSVKADMSGFRIQDFWEAKKLAAYVEIYDGKTYALYGLCQPTAKGAKVFYESSSVMQGGTDTEYALLPVCEGRSGSLVMALVETDNLPAEFNVVNVTGTSLHQGRLKFRMTIADTEAVVRDVLMVYRSKVENIQESMTFQVKKGKVTASIDLNQVNLKQNYWDFYVVLEKGSVQYRMKIRHQGTALLAWSYLKDASFRKDGYIAYPYYARNHALVLCYREESKYDTFGIRMKEIMAMLVYYLARPYWAHRNIWLVYEKFSETAQDNAYYFFRYCMEQLSDKNKKNIYYIIDKDSADYHNVEKYGKHVIKFMSFQHCLYYMAAKMMISTDSRTHAYAWRAKNSLLLLMARKKKLAFLQHGVTAFKKVDHIFGKKSPSNISLFFVTSQFEQDIVFENFGFKREEIPIAGFTRWDALEDKRDEADKQILIMPTWRNWLEDVTDEEFVQSDYFKNYMKLLNDEKLCTWLAGKKVRLMMYIHPKFRNYMGDFSAANPQVTLIPFGEQPLNELIMRCSMLVTDYSSVAWDVYYMGKPVVFYQFDYETYNIAHKSYIDMKTELIGDRTETLEGLVPLIQEYVERDFVLKEEYAEKRMDYYAYEDRNNCQRTYEVIKNIKI